MKRSKPGRGLGLFTTVPIKKGVFVIEYTGKILPNKEADDLGTKYLFEVDDQFTIDGSVRSNKARYINHACKPNCEPEVDEDERRVFIYAIKNIPAGAELTYDYGDEYFEDIITPAGGCKCDSCLAKRGAGRRR